MKGSFICWLKNFGVLYIYLGWVIQTKIQTFPAITLIYRRDNFVSNLFLFYYVFFTLTDEEISFYFKLDSSRFAPRSLQDHLGRRGWNDSCPIFSILNFKKIREEGVYFFIRGDFFLKLGGTLSKNSSKPSLDRPISSFTVKKNHIYSAVSEILCYRQKSLLLYMIG